jgi:hypothetical protein
MIRIGQMLAALASAVTLALTGTGIAHASVSQIQDGFESNPGASWNIQTVGSGHAGFDYNIGPTPRSGRGNGWLHSGYSAGSAGALGTRGPSMGGGGLSHCTAQVYVNPLNNRSHEITVEAFTTSNARIASADRLLAYPGYQPVTLDFDIAGFQSVYVRYTLWDSGRGFDGEWVRLDDFTLSCWW